MTLSVRPTAGDECYSEEQTIGRQPPPEPPLLALLPLEELPPDPPPRLDPLGLDPLELEPEPAPELLDDPDAPGLPEPLLAPPEDPTG